MSGYHAFAVLGTPGVGKIPVYQANGTVAWETPASPAALPAILHVYDEVGEEIDSTESASSDPIEIPGFPYTAGSIAYINMIGILTPTDPALAYLGAFVIEQSLDGGSVWTEMTQQTSLQSAAGGVQIARVAPLQHGLDLGSALQAILVRLTLINGGAAGQLLNFISANSAIIIGTNASAP